MTEQRTEYHAGQPAEVVSLVEEVDELRRQREALVAEVECLRSELDSIRHAAHMPDDYKHGLASWINQHLYGKLLEWTDTDGGPIRRSEDVQEIQRLRLQVAQLTEALEEGAGVLTLPLGAGGMEEG